jgi:arylsulfatase A-like enzyme
VVYAADQGWMGGQNGMWGMGDHFRPVGAHELMMQIPLIIRQPGAIPAGRTSDILVSNYDFMPTVLSYLGLNERLPTKPKLPGRDFSDTLRGREQSWDNVVFYEMERCRAIRTDRWKYVARHPSGPHELYDMQADPRERMNLYGQPAVETIRDELAQRLAAFFDQYADPHYDIWRGGRSKARRLVP